MANYKVVTTIPNEIFRAYDIRGIVGDGFNADNIYTIGLALGSEALERKVEEVVIGRDGRISGPELLAALEAGILDTGCNVINIGEVTTPILYYAACIMKYQSGFMLSGSHNPPNYNGVKMVLDGETLYAEEIQKLYQRNTAQNFKTGAGKKQSVEIIDNYISRVACDVKLSRQLKVVVDCGNGVGGKVAPKLLRALGCEVIELYCDVDGRFPNHQPDPSVPENLRDLITKVKEVKADLGIAFDGDADRVGIVTEQGEAIAADRLLMLFAIDILTRHPGTPIVYDVKCTRHLADQITKHGGIPIMYKTGHSLTKAKMKESGALLAGELSGHMFIKERWFGFDDGIYVASRFLEMLTHKGCKCSEMFIDIPNSVNTPELKIHMAEDKKFGFMETFAKCAKFPGAQVNLIDGVRADFSDGFGLMRPSNTSPNLILRFEGDTKEALTRIQNLFREQLLALDATLKLPF
ncbi:MAG: phosphomannomutase/phosphoglucomutase [Gammaproteobacteria bacterium]|nr:phosphomannomutase/phosphoglucomutase [Gammaproteobacteria bacterium]